MDRDIEIETELAHPDADDHAHDTAEQILETLDMDSSAEAAGLLIAALIMFSRQRLSRAGAMIMVAQILADVYDHAEAEHAGRAQA